MANQCSLDNDPPGLVALFLIKFDVKVGYTITWKRTSEQLDLDGVVEYKSLPSGLHNIHEDLIYFTHEQYAGLSAFVNVTARASERNARFVAVGVLVPRKDGRLGRSWLHARQLKELALLLVDDTDKIKPLEEYWARHELQQVGSSHAPISDSPFTAAQQRSKARALSTATSIAPEERSLPPYHPALSILRFIDAYGPLVFTLHREALLRKRLLIVSRPPMRSACEFVYDISIISTLPLSLAPTLEIPSASMARITPFFNIGIHDIPQLEKIAASQTRAPTPSRPQTPDVLERGSEADDEGWVACTSDEILAEKTKLYDVLLESTSICDRYWPRIKTASGVELLATQRDSRRYRSLQRVLQPMRKRLKYHASAASSSPNEAEDGNEDAQLLQTYSEWSGTEEVARESDQPIEPTSWGEVAYSSFIWWASAGEREEAEIEEEQMDNELLGELMDLAEQAAEDNKYTDENDDGDSETTQGSDRPKHRRRTSALEATSALETALIAYFHRLTKQLFEAACAIIPNHRPQDYNDDDTATTMSSLLGSDGAGSRPRQRRTYLQDDDTAQQAEDMDVHSTELRQMGLDIWSPTSTTFLHEFADVWFGKRVRVHRMGVDCCGVRIC